MEEIIERAGISAYKLCTTLIDTNNKLSSTSSAPYFDIPHYYDLECAFKYLTFTRHDISYVAQQICLHMHDPRDAHTEALKKIIGYIQRTLLWPPP